MNDQDDEWRKAKLVNWERRLHKRKDSDALYDDLRNAYLLLRYDELWRGIIALDEFAQRILKRRPPPYEGGRTGEWSEVDDVRSRIWLAERYGVEFGGETLRDAVLAVANDSAFHPVRQYLDGLQWDGTPRTFSITSGKV